MGKSKFNGEVILWVPNNMAQEILDARVSELQTQGKRVIIFRSGKGNLAELTGDLLRINKNL